MQRTLGPFLLITFLIIGLGLGEMAWTRLSAAGCQEWQTELQRRVEAYARMHLPASAPQVQVQTTCGHSSVPDALYFRWHKLSWRMGWSADKPLEDADLRMAATRDLMQHPAMGHVKFIVRFDASLNSETRKRVESLISRYLMVDEQRQRLEFKRLKKNAETATVKGSVQVPETPVAAPSYPPPLFASTEPQLRAALIQAGNSVFAILLLSLGSIFLLQILRQFRRPSRSSPKAATAASQPLDTGAFAILVAPRVLRNFGERGREVWRLLLKLDRERAARRVLHYWQKDREGLLHFLGLLDGSTQESLLSFLETDQLLNLMDDQAAPLPPREAHRAAMRILLDLARELGQCSQLASAPLFIHLMTRREWQHVAQQMTRPRRRALSELLDKERAAWLRARQDLHPGWYQSGAKEAMTEEQLVRRVRSVLQVEADQLREQLYADREAMQVIDRYFADLTLDSSLNSDLAMLVLGDCHHRHAGFGRLLERRDPHLLTALSNCDDQQVALLLYEGDRQVKTEVYAVLGSRGETIAALVESLEQDKQHSKSLRMQARSLQRFMERQVLVADLFCAHSA